MASPTVRWPHTAFRLGRHETTPDIAPNSDKPTSQHSLDENRVYSVRCIARVASDSVRKEIMSTSTGTTPPPASTQPRVLGTLVADSRHTVRPLLHSRVHRLRISRRSAHRPRTGSLLRRRSHADSDRGRVLRLGCPQSHVVRGGAQDHPGRCGTRRLGRGGDRLQCRPGSAFPLAHRAGRGPGVLHRRLGNHMLTSGLNDFVWAGFVLTSFRARCLSWPRRLALAGPADLERLFARGRSCCARLTGRTTWLSGGFWAPDGAIRGSSRPSSASCGSW